MRFKQDNSVSVWQQVEARRGHIRRDPAWGLSITLLSEPSHVNEAPTGLAFVSLCLVVFFGVLCPARSAAQAPGHGYHPPMPGQQYYVQCRLDIEGKPEVIETAVELSNLMAASDLRQQIELPAQVPPLRLRRYLPRARREQSVRAVKGDEGKPAVKLCVVGPTQSFSRWLVAGDAQRNRLTSLIGTWRYMAVGAKSQRDDLFEQFKNELTREPKLRISRPDGGSAHELSAQPGPAHDLKDLGCKIRVVALFPHFGIDKKSDKPVNQSDKRLNPAVHVEIEADGKKETRWVFAKFSDFKMHEGVPLPYRLVFDCPVETQSTAPGFVLVTVNGRAHEVFIRHEGKVEAKCLALEDKVKVGASQYTFHLDRFINSGLLEEVYVPTNERGAAPALQLESTDDAGHRTAFWLALNQQRFLSTPVGPMAVVFASHQAAHTGVHP